MKASFTARITCSVLAATLAALPCNEALAAPATTTPAPAPTTTPAPAPTATPAPTSAPAPTTTPPATGTTTPATPPATGTPPPEGDPGRTADTTSAVTAPGETPTEVPGEAPAEAPPVEEAPPAEVAPPPPPIPEGPERPPEPTVANGKFKAKGNGLMIAGGTLLGLGLVGVVTSYFLTQCDEPSNSFSCKNKQHNTFAVPATGAAALLGAVLLMVGVGYKVRYKKWERWTPGPGKKTALYPTMLRGGAGVGYTVKF
jgi:hypothetical protein